MQDLFNGILTALCIIDIIAIIVTVIIHLWNTTTLDSDYDTRAYFILISIIAELFVLLLVLVTIFKHLL